MGRVLDLCAIDAGQTDTRYIVLDGDRELLSGHTERGVANILLAGAEDALRRNLASILESVQSRLGTCTFRVVSAGYSGISRERREYGVVSAIFADLFPASRILLDSDMVSAHAANFEGKPGIVLHAGTGAFAYGVDQTGNHMRTGGWGYLLGDRGSGFGLGLAAIRAALEAWERTGPPTGLKDELLRFFEIDDPQTLKSVVYSRDFQRRRIAGFSRVLLEHADRGDPVAGKIVSEGAQHMARLVQPIIMDLDLKQPEIALAGALYASQGLYFEKTMELMRTRYGDQVKIRSGGESPLQGAVWLGMKEVTAEAGES
jgi:N-acetylglucosamine kinase-like BadF-type ATPase